MDGRVGGRVLPRGQRRADDGRAGLLHVGRERNDEPDAGVPKAGREGVFRRVGAKAEMPARVLRAKAGVVDAAVLRVLPVGALLPVGDGRSDPVPRRDVHERGRVFLHEVPAAAGHRDGEHVQDGEELLL